MIEDCVLYGRTLICVMPFYMLQHAFQSLLVTAEKPKMGLAVSVVAGLTNILLDFVLVYVFPARPFWSGSRNCIELGYGGAVPAVFFSKENSSVVRFTKNTVRNGRY